MTLAVSALVAMPALAVGQDASKQEAPVQAPHTVRGELVLFQMTNYNGDTHPIDAAASTVHTDWAIRSLTIHPGDRWQICARPRFRECIVLDRSVHDASMVGIVDQIGSARPAPDEAPNGN